MHRENRVLAALVLSAAAMLAGSQLFLSPIVGLADNGDFLKVMAPAGLGYLSDRYDVRYWSWALKKFAIIEPAPAPDDAASSEILLATAAVEGSRLLVSPRIFDIRALGAIHCVLLLGFLFLVGAGVRLLPLSARWTASILAVFFFTDVGYIAPFNSLYTQVASLLFFLLAAGIMAVAIRDGGLEGPALVAFFLCAALFVVSKPQESVQAPILALLGCRMAGVVWRRGWKQPAAWLAAALCGMAIWYYAEIPRRTIREVGLYHSVFMELLVTSPHPGRDLSDLGLDPELARYAGVTAYAPDAPLAVPAFRHAFFERFGYASLLRFYLSHPGRLLARVRRAGRFAFQLRPGNLGNFDQASGRPSLAMSHRVAAWSAARSRLGPHGGILWIALLVAGNVVAAARFGLGMPGRRLFCDALLALCAMAMLEFLVCSFADYLGDVSRHLYVFQAMWDLLLIIDGVWLVWAVGSRAKLRLAPS